MAGYDFSGSLNSILGGLGNAAQGFGSGVGNLFQGIGSGIGSIFNPSGGMFGKSGMDSIGNSLFQNQDGLNVNLPSLPQANQASGIFGDINFDDLLKLTMAGLSYGQNQDQLKTMKQAMRMQQAEMEKARELQRRMVNDRIGQEEFSRRATADPYGNVSSSPYYTGSAESAAAARRI